MAGKNDGQKSKQIAAELKKRILAWVYPPEHPFVEEALSREFGVSRSPVREALKMLEADGFVRRVPNQGNFVRQINSQEIADLYEVRFALELFALEKVAARPELHQEVKALAEMWRSPPPGIGENAEALAQMDQEYHEKLASLAGNAKLLETLQRVNERLFVFRVMGFEAAIERGVVESSSSIHLGLAWAILSREMSNIRKALEQNMAHGRANVQLAMGKVLTKAYSGPSAHNKV